MVRRALLAALTLVVISSMSPVAQSRRFITEKDLLKFTWVADPQISPDGSQVAFVKVTANEKGDGYDTSLYVVPVKDGEIRRLTSGTRDTTPRWSPDGGRIAFVRTPPAAAGANGKPPVSQIYLLDMSGGEGRVVTDAARGANGPIWSPDGKTIAYSASTGKDAAKVNDRDSDVRVMTKAVYRENGNPGWVDNDHHSHIFTIRPPENPADKPVATQLTDGEFDEGGVTWAPDGKSIYFVSTRVAEPYYDESGSELYAVPASGGAIAKIASIEGSIGNLSPSPDGRRIAFVGSLRGKPIRSYSQPDLWITDATAGSTPKNLTAAYDFDISGGIGGDQAAPRGQNRKPIVWAPDGASLTVVSAEKGSANLKRVTIANGKVDAITDAPQDVGAFSATPNASVIAAITSTQTNIGDIAILDGPGSEGARRPSVLRTITHVNQELFKDIAQSEPEEIWYTSFDGKRIQGWILKPPDFDPSKKYPLILEIHGGPHGSSSTT